MSLAIENIENREIGKLNDWSGFFGFIPTWIISQFLNRPERIICLFTGNRFGKTAIVAYSYILRILGIHPVESKNMRPDKKIRIYRFASQILPNDPEGGEVKNTQYPALKKFLPPHLIKRDITIRKPVVTVYDPQGGADIYFEFVSFNQPIQATAGQERASVWIDESSSQAFEEEQLPRIMDSNGDLIYTLTPAEFMGYEFDEFYERAKLYIRTEYICNRIEKRYKKNIPRIEITNNNTDIVVLQGATDDNPTLSKDIIDDIFSNYSDEDIIDIRRYGIFRQVSGQIFKEFDWNTHVISASKYFPEWIPYEWVHARGIDYHELNPWAVGFIVLSPTDEAFIYDEMNPSPEKFVTHEIARDIAIKSRDYKYALDLTDPRAAIKQSNTGKSVQEDLNRIFFELKKERIGTGAYWQSWDTKSTIGKDEIRKRFKNARLVGKPFCNKGLPTLWILDNCRQTALSFKSLRRDEWANRNMLITRDEKESVQEKWSHFPDVYECIFKHQGFRARRFMFNTPSTSSKLHNAYFRH